MAGKRQLQYPPDDDIVAAVEQAGSFSEAAHALGFVPPTLRSYCRPRAELWERIQGALALRRAPGAPPSTGGKSIDLDDVDQLGDIRALLRSRGIDPDEWFVRGGRVNEWGHNPETGGPYQQLRVDIEPTLGIALPARTDGWKAPKPVPRRRGRRPELVAFLGDHHAPHHDHELHRAAVQWLRDHQPDRIVIVGDLLDYDAVSRHPKNPAWATTLDECVDSGYAIVRAYRVACPDAKIVVLDGNHEDRLRRAVLANLPGAHGVRRARTDEDPDPQGVLTTPHLLRFDELHVGWADPGGGDYEHAQVKLNERLAARHGWISKRGAGASALATIEHLGFSCYIGHCHRQGIVESTSHSIDGVPQTIIGVEVGTMARIRGGLGYASAGRPDWQQGFATATIWPDGHFLPELVTWAGRTLSWRDWRRDVPALALAA